MLIVAVSSVSLFPSLYLSIVMVESVDSAFTVPSSAMLIKVKIQKALNELSKSKTVIMIAHRLSTVQNANCIYVFKDGRLIEQGESGELCKQNGVFATMLENYLTSVKWKVAKEELK